VGENLQENFGAGPHGLIPACPSLQVKRWSQQGDPGHYRLLQGEGEAGGVPRRVSVRDPHPTLAPLWAWDRPRWWGGRVSSGDGDKCLLSLTPCQPAGRPRLQVMPAPLPPSPPKSPPQPPWPLGPHPTIVIGMPPPWGHQLGRSQKPGTRREGAGGDELWGWGCQRGTDPASPLSVPEPGGRCERHPWVLLLGTASRARRWLLGAEVSPAVGSRVSGAFPVSILTSLPSRGDHGSWGLLPAPGGWDHRIMKVGEDL